MLSQGNVSIGPQGMKLIAFGAFDNSGSWFLNGCTMSGTSGLRTFTFSVARSSTKYLVITMVDTKDMACSVTGKTTAKFDLQSYNARTDTNSGAMFSTHFEVWESP